MSSASEWRGVAMKFQPARSDSVSGALGAWAAAGSDKRQDEQAKNDDHENPPHDDMVPLRAGPENPR